jgi:hypothetical protein
MVIGYRKIYPLRRGIWKKTGYRRTPNCLQVKEKRHVNATSPFAMHNPK